MSNPWYVKFVAVVGRPLVLVAALILAAPGEYQLAVLAGWDPKIALLMPLCLSVYAAVSAVVGSSRPKGSPGRVSAIVGAVLALMLALAAQVVAHLIASGHMTPSAYLVGAVSCIPPVIACHLLHLASQHRTEGATAVPATSLVVPESVSWVPEPLPESLEQPPATAVHKVRNVPSLPELRAAFAELAESGTAVTGKTVGDRFGVSERSGRNYIRRVQEVG